MKIYATAVLLASAWPTLVAALPSSSRNLNPSAPTGSSNVVTVSVCNTKYQYASKNCAPTKVTTITLPPKTITLTVSTTTTSTLTPIASVITATATRTATATVTGPTNTATVSTTATVVVTLSTTSTTTQTSAITASVITSTTTITITVPTPPGFTNVYDSSGLTNFMPMKRDELHIERSPKVPYNNYKYGKVVICTVSVQTKVTKTITQTRTVTVTGPTQISTVVALTTTTLTSTVVPPDATVTSSTTLTSTTVLSLTTAVTSFITTTGAVTATNTSSVYAACQTNNILGPRIANGSYIVGSNPIDTTDIDFFVAPSAYDCCVACMNTPGCQYSQFYSTDSMQTTCVTISNATVCNPGTLAGYIAIAVNPPPANISVSNGACGVLH
ncbi:hypothetical protein JX266_011881 [Neoarthrinium moseri]|nr:hypothetical protein JX266_011881 [Neoarthrinium moseri]